VRAQQTRCLNGRGAARRPLARGSNLALANRPLLGPRTRKTGWEQEGAAVGRSAVREWR